MENMYDRVMESIDYIKSKITLSPKIGMILGSGLGNVVKNITDSEIIYYKDIPNFPISTVEGHQGCLVFGKLYGIEVLAMQGRFH